MAENINVTLQKLANSSAKAIQDSVNKANMEGLRFNAQESATARAWQEKMSKSAHQMEVADLKKAGLNPVLSANSGGAQSYSTSSASGSVDSGASAYGSLMSGLMANMTAMKQSEMSAQAQKYSADKSYHAAELSAAAQKYSAQMSAAAQKYSADMSYKTQMEKPQGNPVAVIDKYFGKNASNVIGNVLGKLKPGVDYSNFGDGVYGINAKQKPKINKGLNILGIDTNKLSSSQLRNAQLDYVLTQAEPKSARGLQAAKNLKALSNANKDRARTIAKTNPFAGNYWNPYNNGYN